MANTRTDTVRVGNTLVVITSDVVSGGLLPNIPADQQTFERVNEVMGKALSDVVAAGLIVDKIEDDRYWNQAPIPNLRTLQNDVLPTLKKTELWVTTSVGISHPSLGSIPVTDRNRFDQRLALLKCQWRSAWLRSMKLQTAMQKLMTDSLLHEEARSLRMEQQLKFFRQIVSQEQTARARAGLDVSIGNATVSSRTVCSVMCQTELNLEATQGQSSSAEVAIREHEHAATIEWKKVKVCVSRLPDSLVQMQSKRKRM